MIVSSVNDVKIYNLSSGKSLPDWLSDRKKKSLYHKNVDQRRQIELIQDFEMPGVATSIQCSPDHQYILATGTYKPRIKCYEFNNLSVKFERCFDAEIEKFVILSEDYTKVAFLSCDRHIEFHTASGGLYKLRIPRFGRDLTYHTPSCDLLVAAASSDVYRLNLERGHFLQPFTTDFTNNCVAINPEHYLISVGNEKGFIESFDHRMKKRCAVLDVHEGNEDVQDFQVTSVSYKNGLVMAAGTSTGQVLLYDIRSRRPLIVKDHMNGAPIKKCLFNEAEGCVYSMDGGILKVWDESSGKQIAYIESQSEFNDFCTIPRSGMLFFAQEEAKMLSYYVPRLGPAPRWCSFLDNFVEDIESENVQNIYDDYKFVTNDELVDLGLDYLKGTDMLRSYMHGHFIDVRLYNKVRNTKEALSVERYKSDKVQRAIAATAPNRVELSRSANQEQLALPKYNQKVAAHYLNPDTKPKKNHPNLLQDPRFNMMFEDPDFIVDETTEDFKLVRPVLSRLTNETKKRERARIEMPTYGEAGETGRPEGDSDQELIFSEREDEAEESSSDDDRMAKQLKRQHKILKKERKKQGRDEENNKEGDANEEDGMKAVKKIDVEDGRGMSAQSDLTKKLMRLPLDKRIQHEVTGPRATAHKMEFKIKSARTGQMKKEYLKSKEHKKERSKLARLK